MLFQVQERVCHSCGCADWKGVNEAELAVLLGTSEHLIDLITKSGVKGFELWVKDIEIQISANNGIFHTPSGIVKVRRI